MYEFIIRLDGTQSLRISEIVKVDLDIDDQYERHNINFMINAENNKMYHTWYFKSKAECLDNLANINKCLSTYVIQK